MHLEFWRLYVEYIKISIIAMEVLNIANDVILISAIRWQLRVKDEKIYETPLNKECNALESKKLLGCFYFRTIFPSYT